MVECFEMAQSQGPRAACDQAIGPGQRWSCRRSSPWPKSSQTHRSVCLGLSADFVLLLLVDFPGRPRTRLISYVSLWVAGSLLITIGTIVSTHKIAAVAAMGVVGFAVLFAGILSPQAATASTAALLTFVLPVAVAGPPSLVGARLVGWALAGALCLPACMLVWPTPWHDNLRRRLSGTGVWLLARLTAA